MSRDRIVIQKEDIDILLRELNICSNLNKNKLENPIKCIHNRNNASIIGVDRLTKAFIIINHRTKQYHMIQSHELFRDFQKSVQSEHIYDPNHTNAIFKRSIQDGGNTGDILKNDMMNNTVSDYFSASTSIEEGLYE